MKERGPILKKRDILNKGRILWKVAPHSGGISGKGVGGKAGSPHFRPSR